MAARGQVHSTPIRQEQNGRFAMGLFKKKKSGRRDYPSAYVERSFIAVSAMILIGG